MELRHRHLADTPAGPGTRRPPDDREPHPADSRQADRPATGTGPARDDAHHYEADRHDRTGTMRTGTMRTGTMRTGTMRTATTRTRNSSAGYPSRPDTCPTTPAGSHPGLAPSRPANCTTTSAPPPGFHDATSTAATPPVLTSIAQLSTTRSTDTHRIVMAIPLPGPTARVLRVFAVHPVASKLGRAGPEIAVLSLRLARSLHTAPTTSSAGCAQSQMALTGYRSAKRGRPIAGLHPPGATSNSLSPRRCRFTTKILPLRHAAKAQGGTAWCPVMEKAFAAVDQTWTTERRVTWLDSWASLCAQDQADKVENSRFRTCSTGLRTIAPGHNTLGTGRDTHPTDRPGVGGPSVPSRSRGLADQPDHPHST